MKGVNHVSVSGNVGDKIEFGETGRGAEACGFNMAAEPRTGGAGPVWIRVNVYDPALIAECKRRLARGTYVVVDGQLMNRAGRFGEITEIRAKELIFPGGDVHG